MSEKPSLEEAKKDPLDKCPRCGIAGSHECKDRIVVEVPEGLPVGEARAIVMDALNNHEDTLRDKVNEERNTLEDRNLSNLADAADRMKTTARYAPSGASNRTTNEGRNRGE